MAAMLSSTPPQPLPKHPTSTPLPPKPSQRLPTPLRQSRDRPPRSLHSSPSNDWSFEQRIQESLAVLDLMQAQSMTPDPALFCTLLKSCSDAQNLRFGRIIHDKIIHSGLQSDPFVANNLILMYSRCGLVGIARQLFDEMPVRNVVSWTTVISMYHHAGFPRDALDLFSSMRADAGVMPNAFTYTIALNSCASTGNLEMGIKIHEEIVMNGCVCDNFIIVALIDMYAKCGCLCEARKVFDGMNETVVEACTAMLEGYHANGEGKEAIELFRRVVRSGMDVKDASMMGFTTVIRSCVTEMALRQGQEIHAHIIKFGQNPGMKSLSALVELYEKCDKMAIANRLFNGLVVKNAALWDRMICGYVRNGLYEEALKIYLGMITCSDIGLNPIVVSWALKACVGKSGLEEGKQIHGTAIKVCHILMENSVVDYLVELYSTCGEYENAYKLMKQWRRQANPNLDGNAVEVFVP